MSKPALPTSGGSWTRQKDGDLVAASTPTGEGASRRPSRAKAKATGKTRPAPPAKPEAQAGAAGTED